MREYEKQNKEKSGAHDAVKLFMELKKYGKVVHEYTCTASSLKKGKTKLALGILELIYGEDKKWKELQSEMHEAIMKARDERGAGDKPFLQKYDPNYIVSGQSDGQPDYSELFNCEEVQVLEKEILSQSEPKEVPEEMTPPKKDVDKTSDVKSESSQKIIKKRQQPGFDFGGDFTYKLHNSDNPTNHGKFDHFSDSNVEMASTSKLGQKSSAKKEYQQQKIMSNL